MEGYLLPETLRSLVGNGSIPAKGLAGSLIAYIQCRRAVKAGSADISSPSSTPMTKMPVNILGPLQIILGMEVTYIVFFLAIAYTAWQVIITVMSTLFKITYDLTDLQIGITFISNELGCIIGTLTTGKFLDFDYR